MTTDLVSYRDDFEVFKEELAERLHELYEDAREAEEEKGIFDNNTGEGPFSPAIAEALWAVNQATLPSEIEFLNASA